MSAPWNCIFLAGIGGMMPTISRMASTYVTDPSTPPPEIGLFIGVGLFFIIGSVLAYAFSESNIRQAFIIGICAPGIITNIVAGVQDAKPTITSNNGFSFFSSAIADEASPNDISFIEANPIDPVIFLKNDVVSGTSWDSKRTPYMVRAKLSDGGSVTLGSFPSSNFQRELRIPNNATSVVIDAGKYTNEVKLPGEAFSSVSINSRMVYSGSKNDFLWAIGGKRESVLSSFSTNIADVSFVDNSISIKNILGMRVIIKPSGNAGLLDDIKIDSDGRVGLFKIKMESGEDVSVSPKSVKVTDSVVMITIES